MVIIGPEFSFSFSWQILIFYRDTICFEAINDSDDGFSSKMKYHKPLITRDLQGYFDYDDILYLY